MINYDNLKHSLGFHIGRTSRAIKNTLTRAFAANKTGITSEQWHLMILLWQFNAMPQKEMATICSKDKTTTARLIAGLEKKGLIRRESNPEDNRNKLIFLTDGGKALESEIMPIAIDINEKIEACLDENEKNVLISALTKIYNSINNDFNILQDDK